MPPKANRHPVAAPSNSHSMIFFPKSEPENAEEAVPLPCRVAVDWLDRPKDPFSQQGCGLWKQHHAGETVVGVMLAVSMLV
eukprot:3047598-Rhodomonas_salina.3